MNWEVRSPAFGDIIRVKLSEIYHYGIYVSDAEVIAFGLPPDASRRVADADVAVLATDIDTFRCGRFPEAAVLSIGERLKRFPPRKTVSLARGRIGEKGYHILNNNCEHFVYECVFGVKYCSQTDDVRAAIRQLPIVDIYGLLLPEVTLDAGEAALRRLSAYAAERSFGARDVAWEPDPQNPGFYRSASLYLTTARTEETLWCAISRNGAALACAGETAVTEAGLKNTALARYAATFSAGADAEVREKTVPMGERQTAFAVACPKGSLLRIYAVTETDGALRSKMIG